MTLLWLETSEGSGTDKYLYEEIYIANAQSAISLVVVESKNRLCGYFYHGSSTRAIVPGVGEVGGSSPIYFLYRDIFVS